MARHCKHSLRGGSEKHSPCLGSSLATILPTKQVLLFCLHLRGQGQLPRPTASTVLGQHAAEGLLSILSLSLLEPWEDRLVASDKFYQLHPTPYSLRLFSQYAAQLFASSFFPFPWSKWYEIIWNSIFFFQYPPLFIQSCLWDSTSSSTLRAPEERTWGIAPKKGERHFRWSPFPRLHKDLKQQLFIFLKELE